MSNAASSDASAPPRVIGRPWVRGASGNPNGRPPAPVDIAAMAREHGPRCIDVAAKLLDDPDPRIRLATVIALLDRGFGKPVQAIAATDNATSIQFMHLVAARAFTQQHLQELNGQPVTNDSATASGPPDLMAPALE